MTPVEWIYLIVMLIVMIAAVASMPHPPSSAPQSLSDSGVPLASDGRDMCVIFGECWIDDNNVLNYGAITNRPIKATSGK